ncbi:lipoate--protein ligase family protein [Prochlorococcus marinus]|uniref:Lipoate--protein ligase n=1 Tax=Prochlorococcus marinus XMU1408 TaxID=2213228 RepID=A0A318R547_PROMR|nr:lipoate--protein ligase family protein [Prochlorococcus marinus]MBW3041565.1 lipoate--protein ligase [Prochlorococcus marinus str. XMU1408]PYE02721.1 lipoate--protein ligase [Prochlorococcus marinus XMU1408]
MSLPEKVLYLNPLELSGPEQMAIDLFLLEKSFTDKNFNMAIRFYTWNGDWLSVGKNQKVLPKTWINLSKNENLKIVRRPSGGKSVLHSKGLTYAIVWKYPPRNKKESYLKTAQWLKDGFKKIGVDLTFGNQPINLSNNNCFATSTLADLVDKEKNKYIGSAQYWKKGHLLQHGEILIEPSKRLWKKVFNADPPKIKNELKEKDRIIFYLKESLIKTWPSLKWSDYKLDKKDKELIDKLARDNFKEINHF